MARTRFTLVVAGNVDEDRASLLLDDLEEILSDKGLDVIEVGAICPEWFGPVTGKE